MGKLIRWTGGLACALCLIVLLAWGVSRALGPEHAHRQALERMQVPWDAPGSNAFDALWLMRYPVPEGELKAMTGRDMQRIHALPPATGGGHATDFASEAATRFADEFPGDDDLAMLCAPRDAASCLAKVASDVPAYEALVVRHGALLERHARLARHGHVRNRVPGRVDAPLPRFDTGRLALTRNALLFAKGEPGVALDATCRELDTWRRLGAQSDMLLASIAAITYSTDGNGVLLAAMLRDLPRDHALPASCTLALAPPRADSLSLCPAMRGEHAFTTGALRTMPQTWKEDASPLGRLLMPLLFNADKTVARMAMTPAHYCDADADSRRERDLLFDAVPSPAYGMVEFGCIDNAIGCILSSIAAPAYSGYQNRMLDHGERLRALATLVWLREQRDDTRPLAARIAARPAALKSPAREFGIGEDGRSLRIHNYESGPRGHWEIPLPDYLSEPVAD